MAAQDQTLESLEKKVCDLLPLLPDEVGMNRLVGVYLSLKAARALGYDKDKFHLRSKLQRSRLLPEIACTNPLEPSSHRIETREWVSGYYFNNALIRMAMLTELALKALFTQNFGLDPPSKDVPWLEQWYEKKLGGHLPHLKRIRQELNDLRHKPATRKDRKIDSFREGMQGFEELLELLQRLRVKRVK